MGENRQDAKGAKDEKIGASEDPPGASGGAVA